MTDHAIIERDVRCVRDGSTERLHVHHRRLRSAGADDRPCNMIALCWRCHDWVHKHPRLSRIHGWLVSASADPAQVPVKHHGQGGFVLLDDDYGFAPWPPPDGTYR